MGFEKNDYFETKATWFKLEILSKFRFKLCQNMDSLDIKVIDNSADLRKSGLERISQFNNESA